MSVIMPNFLKKENLKWIEEYRDAEGELHYKSKKEAPREIKDEVRKWEQMFRNAKRNHIQL